GLKNVFRAMIDLVEHSGITPDFGVEGGAGGVKDTNYFPRAPAEFDGVANLEAGIRATHVPAHYQLSQTWMEERALDHFDFAANIQHARRDTANLHIGVSACGNQREGRDNHDLWSYKGPVGGAGHARRVFDDLYLIE